MKLARFLLTVGMIVLASEPVQSKADDADGPPDSGVTATLRAEINLLKATMAQRDKKIKALQKEIKELKAMLAEVAMIDLTEPESKPTRPSGATLRYHTIIKLVWKALTPFPENATQLQREEQWTRQTKELRSAVVGRRAKLAGVVQSVTPQGEVYLMYSNQSRRQKIMESNSRLKPHTTGGLRPVTRTPKPKPLPPLEAMTIIMRLPIKDALKLRRGQSVMTTGVIRAIGFPGYPSNSANFTIEFEPKKK